MPMMEMRAIERGVEVLKARAPKAARRMKREADIVKVGGKCWWGAEWLLDLVKVKLDDGRWSSQRVGVASQRVDAIPRLGVGEGAM